MARAVAGKNKPNLTVLKEIDRAFAILSDPGRRSIYDALQTYNFLQQHAWKNFHINQSLLPKLEAFWAKQHTNNQLKQNLDFDRFIPEYDLLWYTPFYQEFYHKVVEKKEQTYQPTENPLTKTLNRARLTLALALSFLLGGITMLWLTKPAIMGILLLVSGSLGIISGFLQLKQYKELKKQLKTAQANVIDKWIKILPCILPRRLKVLYLIAFEFNGKKFYQKVDQATFLRTKIGAGTEVRYFDNGVPAPFIEIKTSAS